MADSLLLLACHLLLSLALLAASLSHLLLAATTHLSPSSSHLRRLRHPLVRLLPVLLALPFPFLPVSPTAAAALLLLPPLLLPLPLPFLPHLPHLRPLLLSLPLLLLARAASLVAASFPPSDLQSHALHVAAALLLAAAVASLLAAISPPNRGLLAETALACAGAVGGLWVGQSGLVLYVDACVPAGCHRLMDAAVATPATRCDVEEARLRAVALMDLALSVHCVVVAAVAVGVHLGVAWWCGVDGGAGAGMGTGRRHNGVGGSYDALPTVASAEAEMEHLPMKGVVGKSIAQE